MRTKRELSLPKKDKEHVKHVNINRNMTFFSVLEIRQSPR